MARGILPVKRDLAKLPIPPFSLNSVNEPGYPDAFERALATHNFLEAAKGVELHIGEPPFSSAVLGCLIRLVDEISKIESARGDMARSDRSALAPEAQPYQDLIDRILYRMAGLTDAEVQELEKRLKELL